MWRDYYLFNPNMRNVQIRSATCSCIIELYEKWYRTISWVSFPNQDFSPGFLHKIINIAGRISEAANEGAGGAQRPVLRGNKPKRTSARSEKARRQGQNPQVYYIFYVYFLGCQIRKLRDEEEICRSWVWTSSWRCVWSPPPPPPPKNGHVICFVTPSAKCSISNVAGLKYSAYMCARQVSHLDTGRCSKFSTNCDETYTSYWRHVNGLNSCSVGTCPRVNSQYQ